MIGTPNELWIVNIISESCVKKVALSGISSFSSSEQMQPMLRLSFDEKTILFCNKEGIISIHPMKTSLGCKSSDGGDLNQPETKFLVLPDTLHQDKNVIEALFGAHKSNDVIVTCANGSVLLYDLDSHEQNEYVNAVATIQKKTTDVHQNIEQ